MIEYNLIVLNFNFFWDKINMLFDNLWLLTDENEENFISFFSPNLNQIFNRLIVKFDLIWGNFE